MGKETEGRGSMVKWGKALLEGGGGVGDVKILWDSPWMMVLWKLEYMQANIWCMLDWIIGFCHKPAEIHFLGVSCSTFSLFTFHLGNSILSPHAKPSLENNSSSLLISVGVVIEKTVHVYSIKFNFIKALFSVCILVYCSLPTTNWLHWGNQVICYHQNSPIVHCIECEK